MEPADFDKTVGRAITIPAIIKGKTVTSIGKEAFKFRALTSITISDSVTAIGEAAFYRCTSLTAVTFLENAPKAGQLVFLRATPRSTANPKRRAGVILLGSDL